MSLNDLPGAEIILPGLSDLHSGDRDTIGALLIALAKPLWKRIAATRLTEAGLDIHNYHLAPEPELTLYALLQKEREDAYPHYNALLNRLNSFCNALELSHTYQPSNGSVGLSLIALSWCADESLPVDEFLDYSSGSSCFDTFPSRA